MDNAQHTPAVTLLPCPFCGGDGYTSESDQCWFVGCSNCYCNVGEAYDRCAMPDHIFGTEAEAITAWNTRASTADLQARLDAAGCTMQQERARLLGEVESLRSYIVECDEAALTERDSNGNCLHAAAPDLLAACLAWESAEEARNDCTDDDGCDNEGPWEQCPLCSIRFGEAIDLRHAAIAKALATARSAEGQP